MEKVTCFFTQLLVLLELLEFCVEYLKGHIIHELDAVALDESLERWLVNFEQVFLLCDGILEYFLGC